jgi:hypothetical protein
MPFIYAIILLSKTSQQLRGVGDFEFYLLTQPPSNLICFYNVNYSILLANYYTGCLVSGSNLHSISVLYTEYAVPIAFCLALLYSSYELVVYCLCKFVCNTSDNPNGCWDRLGADQRGWERWRRAVRLPGRVAAAAWLQ